MSTRILFVDDEQSVLDGLRRVLRSQRPAWEMRFALSVDDALRQMHKASFDVVVTDIRMPDTDGFALLASLRESKGTRDIPVIVLTAVEEHDTKRRALESGATDLLTKPIDREDLIARLRCALRLKARQDELKALNASLEQKVTQRTSELEYSRQDIIWRLAKAGEYRDEDTGNHVVRVACYCQLLAEELGMSRDFVETLFLASPLHDVGKIGVPDRILLKPGPLMPEERKTIERHCVIGARLLGQYPKDVPSFLLWRPLRDPAARSTPENPILKMASSIAMTHHEWWGGTGYPESLKGEAIPLEGRIAALADVYDALCSARPYKPAYPQEKTLAIMRDEARRHFDPDVYAAFEKLTEKFKAIRTVYADETSVALSGSG